MKYKLDVGSYVNLDVDILIVSVLGFEKKKYSTVKHTKIVDIMCFNTINFYCYTISCIKDNGKGSDILHTFNLIEPPGIMIANIPTNVLKQICTNNRIEKNWIY